MYTYNAVFLTAFVEPIYWVYGMSYTHALLFLCGAYLGILIQYFNVLSLLVALSGASKLYYYSLIARCLLLLCILFLEDFSYADIIYPQLVWICLRQAPLSGEAL